MVASQQKDPLLLVSTIVGQQHKRIVRWTPLQNELITVLSKGVLKKKIPTHSLWNNGSARGGGVGGGEAVAGSHKAFNLWLSQLLSAQLCWRLISAELNP